MLQAKMIKSRFSLIRERLHRAYSIALIEHPEGFTAAHAENAERTMAPFPKGLTVLRPQWLKLIFFMACG
jgi:hypothetical protein